ncbi:transketolase [Faecalicatena acetigenes]|jgi:transketolase|uniref:Transketolase n=1 Tax=Faecalicatena acetigenes TaxID=2981790 RepID=A0ABT2T732_9FIRM|nr:MULTISPECIES: transketolase [Lachnospiraceae]MCU6746074.1 transketolase [Faecalicatena acetigenes]SCG93449.1 Transketolase [uncultured Clostridium sp.]
MKEQTAINAIRILSADAIQKAKSGHPGLPLGAAPIAYELWAHHMSHNPKNPKWMNRDRFILSAGHGSAMLYSLLHLFGYGELSVEDLKQFRQLDSLTPGHPEYRHTVGVEATTGPLGAGLGMAVGMAMAEKHLAAKFNKENYPVIDHYTYVLCGDGCLMEGISSEVMSLAGTLGLGKLIVLYDSNSITIEGGTDLAFTEDVTKRFEAFGFRTYTVQDGNDIEAVGRAIEKAKEESDKPAFIKITTKIGYGVPAKEGKACAHGEPLGEENVKILRKTLNWPCEEPFKIPDEVYDFYKELASQGEEKETVWNAMMEEYAREYPDLKAELERWFDEDREDNLIEDVDFWKREGKAEATRSISGKALNYIKDKMPNLVGGSADLGPSNKTIMSEAGEFSKETPDGRNIHFGVREIGMTAIANGMLLHGGLKTYTATFFVFVDYMKPMLRLSSLMQIPQIAVLSHDSIGVGEDGPTHEPIEQLAMLRSMPNMYVFRPADEIETKAAWYTAVTSKRTPTCLVVSRQNLPVLAGTSKDALFGGYVLRKEKKSEADLLMFATGSEAGLAVEAAEKLEEQGISARVVSMPCMELFEEQTKEYKESVIPANVKKRVAIEAGCSMPWYKYAGIDGCFVTMDTFGASAPAGQLFEKYGFSVDNVVTTIENYMRNK